MRHRIWILSIVAICFLGVTSWAQGQGGQQMTPQMNGQNTANPQQQNPSQNGKQNADEENKPQAPRYLTYTKEANPGLTAGKSAKTYIVDFKSVPSGADVVVDGYFLGHTPTTVQIPAGKHILSIQKWGYREWLRTFDVSANSSLNVNPNLKPDW
ncbi:MAG: PEGA domain-containing protein [Acidobacteria bacterium]|nr:PEGA domain-containing protein [Acidobacteriota bacterium]